MGTQSTDLNLQWLAVDAGATRIRVAPVLFSDSPSVAGGTQEALFETPSGPGRVEQAARLVRCVADQLGWRPPYRLALAWAGAPTPDQRGTQSARYGPAIPDLVQRLAGLLPLKHLPCLHSDARAALEGAALQYRFGSAYGLTSGSGLGEAYFENGATWSREKFQDRLGRASQWIYQGQDGESWLRADSWRDQPLEPFQQALRCLVKERLKSVQPEVIALGGHFRQWFQQGWLDPGWWSRPIIPLTTEHALLGSVHMERRRLTSENSIP